MNSKTILHYVSYLFLWFKTLTYITDNYSYKHSKQINALFMLVTLLGSLTLVIISSVLLFNPILGLLIYILCKVLEHLFIYPCVQTLVKAIKE